MAIKYISIVLGAIFEIYCINVFINSFSNKKEIRKQTLIISLTLITLYHIAISCLLNGTILTILALLTPFAISQLYKSRQYIKIILSIGISLINICSELAVSGIIMILENDNYTTTNSDLYSYSIGLLLSKFLVFVIVLIFSIKKRKFEIDNIGNKYLIILSILPITTIIFGVFMNQIILATNQTFLKIIYVILNLLLMLSNIVTFEIVNNQNRLAKAEYELQLLKNNVDEQTKHYEEIRSSQEEIRKIRHDLKNTCLGAVAELKAGKTENAIEQLQYNIDIIEKSNKVIDTGHPSIDAIIENKINRCDDLCIHTDILYRYNEVININEIEIAVIVGNILDNAIEACQKVNDMDREIWGTIASDNQNIIIDIRNTAVDSNNFKTSKADRKSHGFGLNSISHIAKKYKGYAKFTFENNEFRSFVILDN